MKNPCAKRRELGNPYEVYVADDGTTWQVLKKYKSPEAEAADPYARWHCALQGPYTSSWERRDQYAADIKRQAKQVPLDMWKACGLDTL